MSKFLIAGTTPSPIDHRDYIYISPFTPEELDPVQDLTHTIREIDDQLTIGACVGKGVTSQLENIDKANGNDNTYSAMALYNMTKAYEGRLGQEGLATRDAYKVAYRYGVCLAEDYPYDLSMDNIDPPPEIYGLADENKVSRYESVAGRHNRYDRSGKIHAIRSALQEGMTVGMACIVTDSLYDLKGPWRAHDYQLHTPTNEIGGHYMLIVKADDERQMFVVENSWGTDWGDSGLGGLPYSIVDEPFFEAWAVRRFKDMEIPETPGIKTENLNRYTMTARIVPKPDEIGQKVKIWVGGILPDGQGYLKPPCTEEKYFTGNYTDLSGESDTWVPAAESEYLPVIEEYEIKDDNPIRVISWRDLSEFAGSAIYVAYGTTGLVTSTISHIATIPDELY